MLRRTAAIAATALLAAGLIAGPGAAAVWAADDPTPSPSPKVSTSVEGNQVTITTDLATAQAACARVATAEQRLTQLVARIQGDANTPGSVAYLQARAQHAAGAGHDDLANTLNARATRRAGWVDDLQRAIDRLKQADTSVCAALPAAGQ